MPVSVKVDTKDLEKAFSKVKKNLPRATARAINETANWSKSNAEKDTAAQLRIPQKLVKKRLDVKGGVKSDRTTVRKANKNRLSSTLDVYVRGIPVGQVANKPTKRQNRRPGVKAKGGRLYQGAFYAPGAAPHGFVFKRRRSGQLMMPKIGVRQTIDKRFMHYIVGNVGIAEYRRRWERLAKFELSKI